MTMNFFREIEGTRELVTGHVVMFAIAHPLFASPLNATTRNESVTSPSF